MAQFCSKAFTITVGELGLTDLDDKAFCVGSLIPDQTVFATLNIGPGAVEPFTWEVIEGVAELAAAGFLVNLDSGDEPDEFYFTLHGTPTVPGAVTFTVQVRDDATPDNNAAEREFTVWAAQINQPAGALAAAGLNQSYSETITQTGAPAVVNFSVTSGTLPAGLVLNGLTGVISGTPTVSGTSNFTVTLSSSGA